MASEDKKLTKKDRSASKKKIGQMPRGPERTKALVKALSEGLNRHKKRDS